MSTFDGQTIRMLADLILEPVRNGLIDLLRFKLDESPGWMKTFGPESCLSWCKTDCAGGMFHLDASKSFCFFALNIPSYPKHAGTIMSSLATILKELLLQGAEQAKRHHSFRLQTRPRQFDPGPRNENRIRFYFAHSSAKHPLFTEADGCVMDSVKVAALRVRRNTHAPTS
jgi:hypothetical protein